MKLRVIHEPWKTELQYVVQEYNEKLLAWLWVSNHYSEADAEVSAQLRLKGPIVLKVFNTEFEDHERTFL